MAGRRASPFIQLFAINFCWGVMLLTKCSMNICSGVQVLVDGAHALGALQLDLRKLDADFYVSNAHKWFCSPKGAAFLYVRRDLKPSIHPLVISHGYGSGFNSEFIWAGEDLENQKKNDHRGTCDVRPFRREDTSPINDISCCPFVYYLDHNKPVMRAM